MSVHPTPSRPTTSGPTTSGPTTSGPTTSGPSTSGPSTRPADASSLAAQRSARARTSVPVEHTLSRLQHEWQRLARSRAAIERAQAWGLPTGSFHSLDELLRLAGYGVARTGAHDDDAVLGALVRLAGTDELAARVVLQRVMPGIASLGRRASFRAGLSATDDLLAAAWTVIRTYPIDRRPHYVAAGLLRSIGYAAADPMDRRVATFVTRPTTAFDLTAAAEPEQNASEELADLLALATSAGVAADDVDLLRRLGQGMSTLQLAAERQVSDRTIRNHRAAAAHRLRTVARSVA